MPPADSDQTLKNMDNVWVTAYPPQVIAAGVFGGAFARCPDLPPIEVGKDDTKFIKDRFYGPLQGVRMPAGILDGTR
jgi:hypothetical protein